jgi:replicative DNA helicase
MTVPDLTLDAGLPANVDAEKTILGAVLLDNAAYLAASEKLDSDDFSLDSHRRIFLRMSDLFAAKQAIDIVTLCDILSKHKEVEAVGGVSYLASLTEGLPRRPVIEDYVRIVKDKSLLRKIMLVSSSAIARAADQSETAAYVAEALSFNIQRIYEQTVTSPLETFGNYIAQAYPSIDLVFEHSARSLGIASGIRELDELTCGFQRENLIVVAARPGMGKTAFGLTIAANAAIDAGRTVAVFSLEMGKKALLHRLVAMRGSLSLSDVREGRWTETSRRYALEAMNDIVGAPLYIDDQKGLTVQRMQAKAARLKAQMGALDLIVIDQLNHIQPPPGSERYAQRRIDMGFITRGLNVMAASLDVPVVVLHQLSRENEKRDSKRPKLSDLRESGSVEEDADVVIFPHRPAYYEEKKKDAAEDRETELIVAKQRNGPLGSAHCEFYGDMCLFRDKEQRPSFWA